MNTNTVLVAFKGLCDALEILGQIAVWAGHILLELSESHAARFIQVDYNPFKNI
jgi:hypothetical protein